MPTLDIFGNSAFSLTSLTDAINKIPFVPGRLGQLGIFDESGVSTTSVMIEEREGSLTLIETSQRGAPAQQNQNNKRKARSLVVPHIALEDTILADEVQNVRAFGSESQLDGVQNVVNSRLRIPDAAQGLSGFRLQQSGDIPASRALRRRRTSGDHQENRPVFQSRKNPDGRRIRRSRRPGLGSDAAFCRHDDLFRRRAMGRPFNLLILNQEMEIEHVHKTARHPQ